MNQPSNTQTIDHAAEETARLNQDYGYLDSSIEELLNEAAAFEVVSDADDKGKVMTLIKRIRDQVKSVLGIHELEKVPHLRRGQAVDQFFFSKADALARRDRKARPGAADHLNDILTAYDQRILAEENERRRLAAIEAQRKAREEAAKAAKLAQEAEEKRLTAERARAAHTQAAKAEAAQEADQAASAAAVEAELAQQNAEKAYIDTLVTPADIMRTRGTDGTLATMGQEKFAEITDRSTLDLKALAPYIPLAALETALRSYAATVGYSSDASVQIKGAIFGKRDRSRVR